MGTSYSPFSPEGLESTLLDWPILSGWVGGPQAGQQSAPHMHVLVCICSNVRQFH